jgi:maleylacetoacetate isomerase
MSQIILHNYYRSSTSYRVRLALEVKKIPYLYQAVNLLKSEQKVKTYAAISPLAEVPTLQHGDRFIAQSFAIVEYLDEVFPETPLFPKDFYIKALVRQFCENINSYLHPLSNLKVMQRLEELHGYDQKQKENWIAHWQSAGLHSLEAMARNYSKTYCFGDHLTAADIFLIPALFSARRFNVPLQAYANLLRIEETCLKLASFIAAHPSRQPDAI